MHEIHQMKGQGRPIIALAGKEYLIMLVSFADGSWGIVRNERALGIWEPAEQEACFHAFAEMVKSHAADRADQPSGGVFESHHPFAVLN